MLAYTLTKEKLSLVPRVLYSISVFLCPQMLIMETDYLIF